MDGYTLSAASIRKLKRDNRRLARTPANQRQTLPDATGQIDVIPPEPALFAKNIGEEEIPAFACMAVSNVVTINDSGRLSQIASVAQPDTTFRRAYLVNGPRAIPIGTTQRIVNSPVMRVLYDTGTPALGEGWGPKPGQWTLAKHYPQTATVLGEIDSENKIMLCTWQLIGGMFATANGTIAADASGAISIHQGAAGSTTAIPSMDPTAFNAGPAVASADELLVDFVNGQMTFMKRCTS